MLASLNDLKKAGLTPHQVLDFVTDRGLKKLEDLIAIYSEVERLCAAV